LHFSLQFDVFISILLELDLKDPTRGRVKFNEQTEENSTVHLRASPAMLGMMTLQKYISHFQV
jgi:hypothetical protein